MLLLVLNMKQLFIKPARVPVLFRKLTSGSARVSEIDKYVLGFDATIMPRKRMARTGWSVPFLGFGSDNIGSPPSDRMSVFLAAAAKKGCNLFTINGGRRTGHKKSGQPQPTFSMISP